MTSDEEQPADKATLLNRAARAVGIATEGALLCFAIAAIAILCAIGGLKWIAACLLLAAILVGAFFRDPERHAAATGSVIISGADGKVTEIAQAEIPGQPGTVYHRVSVFMSPLNVHVNRAPIQGEVVSILHTPGSFHAAFRDYASEYNERNLILFTDRRGTCHGMMQIAGYLARRIVCRLHPRQSIAAGQRIGLIMFGSRVDHFIPLAYKVTVSAGERVRAGETILGELIE